MAADTLSIKAGAGLSAPDAPKFDVIKLSVAGDAALVRITGGANIQVDHTAPDYRHGTLIIEPEARIKTTGSAYFDATKHMDLNGWMPDIGSQGLLGLAAPGILITDKPGAPDTGLQIQPAQLQVLNQPGNASA